MKIGGIIIDFFSYGIIIKKTISDIVFFFALCYTERKKR